MKAKTHGSLDSIYKKIFPFPNKFQKFSTKDEIMTENQFEKTRIQTQKFHCLKGGKKQITMIKIEKNRKKNISTMQQ